MNILNRLLEKKFKWFSNWRYYDIKHIPTFM